MTVRRYGTCIFFLPWTYFVMKMAGQIQGRLKLCGQMPLAGTGKPMVESPAEYEAPEDLERSIEIGFREGFTKGLGNPDELLLTLNR